MSYSIDANLLLYACNETSPQHQAARRFLDSCAEELELLCITWPVLFAFVRIATHPSIFDSPLTPEEAWADVESLLSLPRCVVITEASDFPFIYHKATEGMAVRGNHVTDAHIASLLLQHGVRKIYTADSDFRKFPFLEVINPLV